MACKYGLPPINYGLLWGRVACCFGLFGFPGRVLAIGILGFLYGALTIAPIAASDGQQRCLKLIVFPGQQILAYSSKPLLQVSSPVLNENG